MASETITVRIQEGESVSLDSSLIRLTADDVLTVDRVETLSWATDPPVAVVCLTVERTGLTI